MATQKKAPAKPGATAKSKVPAKPKAAQEPVDQTKAQHSNSDVDAGAQTDDGDTPVSGDAGLDGDDTGIDNGTEVASGVYEVDLEAAGFDADKPLLGVASKLPRGFWRCGIHFEHRAARLLNIVSDGDVRLGESGVSTCQRYITQAVADRLQAEPHLEVDVLESE